MILLDSEILKFSKMIYHFSVKRLYMYMYIIRYSMFANKWDLEQMGIWSLLGLLVFRELKQMGIWTGQLWKIAKTESSL